MTTSPTIAALDVGGANLKAAHSSGPVVFKPFALWKDPSGLSVALSALLSELPTFDVIAVTMTGELCDCFETKRQGVIHILNAVAAVAPNVPVWVWQTDGALVEQAKARQQPLLAAAANWLALATFAGRFAPQGGGIVIDIGSTTTDIIPLWEGHPVPRGRTDRDRLNTNELLYSGVRRTPVCRPLLGSEGAAEFFATTQDVYLLLDQFADNENDSGTADGRPATKAYARARLARMLCADAESCSAADVEALAIRLGERQLGWLVKALSAVAGTLSEPPRTVIIAGAGEFLARRGLPAIAPATIVSLQEKLGPETSIAACAHALAILTAERAGA